MPRTAHRSSNSRQNASKARKGRAIWRGMLRISLVTIPVELYPSKVKGGGDIDLTWLHKTCHSRIHYKKICPIHGEVDKDEIVSGYQYSQNKYVIIEPEELAKLRSQSDKIMTVDAFIPPAALDEIYFTDMSYFILPDGAAAEKPYEVFYEAMQQQENYGIAKIVLFKRDHVVVVRPYDHLMLATALTYAERFKKPTEFKEDVPNTRASSKELELAKTLMDVLKPKEFDFSEYKDPYRDRVMELVQAKMSGQAIEVPPEEEEPATLNFMDALKKSLSRIESKNGTDKGNGSHAGNGKHDGNGKHVRHTRRRKVS